MLMKIKRFMRVVYYTFVMYVITHAIVLALFPFWLVRSLFYPEKVMRLKETFGRLLFKILNKEVDVSGLNNVEAGKRYLIMANYTSGYADFVIMMLFPQASILVHAFMSKAAGGR